MRKYVMLPLVAILFLFPETMAAKFLNSYRTLDDEEEIYFTDSSSGNILMEECLSYVDYTQRTPFEEEEQRAAMQAMAGPPRPPADPGNLPVPSGLYLMLSLTIIYTVWNNRKKIKHLFKFYTNKI